MRKHGIKAKQRLIDIEIMIGFSQLAYLKRQKIRESGRMPAFVSNASGTVQLRRGLDLGRL